MYVCMYVELAALNAVLSGSRRSQIHIIAQPCKERLLGLLLAVALIVPTSRNVVGERESSRNVVKHGAALRAVAAAATGGPDTPRSPAPGTWYLEPGILCPSSVHHIIRPSDQLPIIRLSFAQHSIC